MEILVRTLNSLTVTQQALFILRLKAYVMLWHARTYKYSYSKAPTDLVEAEAGL
jgi:hypothetical protein